ncbi:hypothetical protein B0I35DRAFT_248602 [Stachybotrys elegans]|uniref:Uncharacterized protein n=1 Tax=Stachybotrys elegans TaxID=80388 RepID=A0A8K0SMI2_9HYPO|nr:hypothetical protein B0I35DRAFT_248602 [Stachybotrys elegans]
MTAKGLRLGNVALVCVVANYGSASRLPCTGSLTIASLLNLLKDVTSDTALTEVADDEDNNQNKMHGLLNKSEKSGWHPRR